MRRHLVHTALMAAGTLLLAACGFADSRAPVPEFMRNKAADPAPPEPPPDVKRLVREKLDLVFTAASKPSRIRVSAPQPALSGPGWTACVRAELTSVIGKPLGMQTYRISIGNGTITDRRRVDVEDSCAYESYQPI